MSCTICSGAHALKHEKTWVALKRETGGSQARKYPAIVLAILTFALIFKTFVLPSNMNPFAGSRNSSYEEYDEGESDEDFWND